MTIAEDVTQPVISIGLLSPGWPPSAMANGVASYVGTISHALKDLGVPCQVLTRELVEEKLAPGQRAAVHVVRCDNRPLYSKVMLRIDPRGWPQRLFAEGVLREVERLHREGKLELLELEESFGWARHLVGRSPVPIVVRLHGPWFLNGVANGVAQDAVFRRRDAWEKSGLEAADGITAPSQAVLDAAREHFALPLANAKVIANPVEPVAPKDRWNLKECDRNRIVFVGRFDRHKGGDVMIDAFARIVSEHPEARLDFVGPDRGYVDERGQECKIDQYLRTKLSTIAREKITIHGFVPGMQAAKLRKRALVTVVPSRYETFGIAAAEAMMAGCPLVASAVGALTELVQNDRNGLTSRAGDAADLEEKVLGLLRNPARAETLGNQAAIDAAERYAPRVVAEQTLQNYQLILSDVFKEGMRALSPGRPLSAGSSA